MRIHDGGEKAQWQEQLIAHILIHKQESERERQLTQKCQESFEAPKPAPSDILPLTRLHLPKTSPKSTTNWRSNVQIQESMRNVFHQTTTVGVVSSAGLMRCYSSLFHFLAKFAQLGLPSHYHPASSWEPQKLCSADHGRDSPKPWARINVSVYKLIHRFCFINGKLANTKPAAVREKTKSDFIWTG